MQEVEAAERKLPKGLSPSSMEMYHQCPRRFEVQKIDGGYEPSGYPALLGTFVHRILELLMQHPPEERTIETAKECAKKAWPETDADPDFQLLQLDEDAKRKFRWSGWHSVENYFTMEDPKSVEVEATEQWVEARINGVLMRGIIDRLDRNDTGQLVISDYKNGKVPGERYRGSKWEQLAFYAAVVQDNLGITPVQGRLIFTAHGEVLETPINDASVTKVITKVTATWSDIEADFHERGFRATPNNLCGWCPILPGCPEGMAHCYMQMKKGRLKQTAPGYAVVQQLSR